MNTIKTIIEEGCITVNSWMHVSLVLVNIHNYSQCDIMVAVKISSLRQYPS